MVRLFEFTADYERVRALAQDPDIDPQAIADTLESIQGEVSAKVLATARIIRELEADADATDAEARRLADLARTRRARVDGLREYVRAALLATNTDAVKDAALTVRLQQGPASVEVTDADRVPSTFKRAAWSGPLDEVPEEWRDKVKTDIDKRAILQANKDGADVQGARIVRSKFLRIL